MARPTKQGIDYFPMDVDADKDDKLQMIIAEFGYKGEALYTKLCCWIYKHQGYYIEWTEVEQLKFANRVTYILGNSQVNLVNSVVAKCVRWGLFDERLFNMYHILTSKRIQSTWWEATRKRKERVIDEKIWLLGVNDGSGAEEIEFPAEVMNKVKYSKVKRKNIKKENEPTGSQVLTVPAGQDGLREEYEKLPKTKIKIIEFIQSKAPPFAEPYVDCWNVFAGERGLPLVGKLTDKRRRHLAARAREKEFDFVRVLSLVSKSDFLLSGSWFCFDWLVKNSDNYTKILEGNYVKKQGVNDGKVREDGGDYAEKRERQIQRTRELASE